MIKYNNYSIKEAVAHINSDLNTYEIQPDMDYLKSVLSLRRYSKSKTQDNFANTLEEFYSKQKAIVERDSYGNVYVTKGLTDLYPCMVAHLDINQTKRDNVTLHVSGDIMFGFDSDEGVQAGMGADDGCGIALAYEMFKRFDNIKLFFPKNEEVGCIGSNNCDTTFFTNCSMILQGDRRSYTTDLITHTNGIQTCSKEFVNAASEIMDRFGYSENRGVCTDIGAIKKDSIVDSIACNISIGYFNEHSDEEVISIKAYYNAVNFVYNLVKELGNQKWHHIHQPKQLDLFNNGKTKSKIDQGWSGSSSFSNYDFGYDYFVNDTNSPFDTVKKTSKDVAALKTIDEAYNDYVLDVYAMMKETENRDNLESWDPELEDIKEFCSQEEIDSLLMQEMCPYCLDKVEISNELLLNISCATCYSFFNSTNHLDEHLINPRENPLLTDDLF